MAQSASKIAETLSKDKKRKKKWNQKMTERKNPKKNLLLYSKAVWLNISVVGRYNKIPRWIVYKTQIVFKHCLKNQIHEGLLETLPAAKPKSFYPVCSLRANNSLKFIAKEIMNVAIFPIKMKHARSVY